MAAFPFGEFDPQAGSNPLLLCAIYGQRAFVSCHRCPQMAKLNMLQRATKGTLVERLDIAGIKCKEFLTRVTKSVSHS